MPSIRSGVSKTPDSIWNRIAAALTTDRLDSPAARANAKLENSTVSPARARSGADNGARVTVVGKVAVIGGNAG